MSGASIRVGTRGSDLALRQSGMVLERLRAAGRKCELVIIQTRGDQSDKPFREIEGKAFFTKELDEALLARTIDLAIHSLKDLPTDDPPGLVTCCVLGRADARDLLLLRPEVRVSRDASGSFLLPFGTRVGTSSARRFAQLESAFPGVKVVDLRGNVPTRVSKLRRGEYDAIVIAKAGVNRLELELKDLQAIPLDAPKFLPAPGQGVLAARLRADDPDLLALVRKLAEPDDEACARAERRVLESLDGGCSLPLGALARKVGERIVLEACLWRDGTMLRAHAEASDPVAAADAVARELGAGSEPLAPMVPALLLTRPGGLDHDLANALREQGLAVISQPAIRFEAVPIDDRMRALLRALDQFDVVALTSRHAVTTFVATARRIGASLERMRVVAAVGTATASELAHHGLEATLVGDGSGSVALAELLANRLAPGAHVLHPGPAEPETAFGERLAAARIRLTSLPLYQTRPIADDPSLPPGAILAVLASPSAARAFVARPNVRAALTEKPVRMHLIAGGATTAVEIRRLGHAPIAIASSPSIQGVVPAVADALEQLARAAPEVPA